MAEGLAVLLEWDVFLAMTAGVVIGSLASAIPGLGGSFAIGLTLPIAFGLETFTGLALLMGVTVVSGTANTITSVMFGVPGSASSVASTFDGFPMARMGQPRRAIGAGLTASAIGGVLGAVFLMAFLPVALYVILRIGPPEFFAMILLGLATIAFVNDGPKVKALVAAGLGLLVSFVGVEPTMAQERLIFGTVYLRSGIPLVPLVIGMFAIAQLMELGLSKGSMVSDAVTTSGDSTDDSMYRGFIDTLRYWRTAVQSTVIGVGVGTLPGLGAPAAQFTAYGAAARTAKTRERFGKGSVEGVIAADAATNSVEGGALIPTLAFGIPGSTHMALILAAIIGAGIAPGPRLLQSEPQILWLIISIVAVGSIMASIVSVGLARLITLLVTVRIRYYAPILLGLCIVGAYSHSRAVADVLVAVGFGLVGYIFMKYEYSRATFVIAYVLGPLLERHLLIARQVYDFPFFDRPITVVIYIVFIVLVAIQIWSSRRSRARSPSPRA